MKKQLLFLLSILLLTSCSSTTETTKKTTPVTSNSYEQYTQAISSIPTVETYTVAVTNTYMMSYSDSTMSAYDMDGVLQVGKDYSHYSQNIDSNGTRSTFEGDYYDGKLYTTFNGVSYYEEMDEDNLKEILLVPLQPITYTQDQIDSLTIEDNTYSITFTSDAASSILLERYDKYGLDQYDGYSIQSGEVEDTFDDDGNFISEKATFKCTITLSGEEVNVTFTSTVEYSNINDTEVTVSDETKKEEAQYVTTDQIDTDSIETLTDDDDSQEDTVVATFKKRLVSRLNYTLQEDGSYVSNFNNDNEQYLVDFDKHIFEYSNRTVHYVYNWKSDQGSMGSCTLDFTNDVENSECKDTTVETIKEVKQWLQMELYYCGLTLDGLVAEAR